MESSITRRFSALAVFALLSSPLVASAQMTCEDTAASSCYLIHGGLEVDGQTGGVPNWAQKSFVGTNDCGPTAAGMLLGYWDANGWPCLIPGSPYYSSTPSDAIIALDWDLKNSSMPYSWLGAGTPPSQIGNLMSAGIREVIQDRAGGDSWDWAEYEYISESAIMQDVLADRPVLLCTRYSDDPAQFASGGEPTDVSWHWATVQGFRIEDGDFFFAMRSGAHKGGDDFLWYVNGFWSDLYSVHIRPPGPAPASCVDFVDSDGDGFMSASPGPGFSVGDDCADINPARHPGATEICNGVDDDCDGVIDFPVPDTDGDGIGDLCDSDDDGDGTADELDNCPGVPNDQADFDGDGIGDLCDACPHDAGNDPDGDGVCSGEDLCPTVYQPENLDADGDGIGDVCDGCMYDAGNDADGDGLCESVDNCDSVYNPCQADSDGDGVGDVCECRGSLRAVRTAWIDGGCPVFNARASISSFLNECGRFDDSIRAGASITLELTTTWEAVLREYGPSPFVDVERRDPGIPPDPLWDPMR